MNPPDFASVVAENWRKTTGYLVAGHEPCIQIGQDEVRHVRRRLVIVDLAAIENVQPEGSWFMAVIVCRGDDLSGLAAWAARFDVSRIHFYLHTKADTAQLVPWRDAGLPLDRIDEGHSSWRSLHKVLGWDLNVRVYDDHVAA
jgi:hypothetical protein